LVSSAAFITPTASGSRSLAVLASPVRLHNNNFTLLRLFAASLVIISHGFELPTGITVRDWAYELTYRPFSWYAVDLFFVLSGYLIFRSWQRNPSASAFIQARFLRLFPGLFVMLVITIFTLGLCFSSLPFRAFMENIETFRYFIGCLSIVFVKYNLPGVFTSNPVSAVNGSLWTLRYELFCYVMVLISGKLGLFSTRKLRRYSLLTAATMTIAALVSFDLAGLDSSNGRMGSIYEFVRLLACFQFGTLYAEFRDTVPLRLSICFALFLFTFAVIGTILFTFAAILTVTYATFWLAFVPQWSWLSFAQRGPDYSYGLYIYAFPVQQALINLIPGITPKYTIILGYSLTMVLATLSWHFIERPVLSYKRRAIHHLSMREH
jgi:peptidoglycan/LPS O-acetylase OafA/YrhL